MIQPLVKLNLQIKNQIQLIKSSRVDLMDKIILTRSTLENYAILNFLQIKNTQRRIELFRCFGDFEWYSHHIYYAHPLKKRLSHFVQFLNTAQRKYPNGYQRYGRLIKRRCCKQLRKLIKSQPNQHLKWQRQLDLINSDKKELHQQQQVLLADYMSHHLITKLPFPYRIVFGKSITYFVLKYSPVNRTTYWLLADLSHGTLAENHLDQPLLVRTIKKILQIINTRINQN